MQSLPPKIAQQLDEWLEQALACAEEFTSPDCEDPGNADNLFISYLLSRLRHVGVTNAKAVMDRLQEKRETAINAKAQALTALKLFGDAVRGGHTLKDCDGYGGSETLLDHYVPSHSEVETAVDAALDAIKKKV